MAQSKQWVDGSWVKWVMGQWVKWVSFLDRQVEFRGHVGIRKLEFLVFGVSCMILSLAVLTQHPLVTDGRRTHNDSIYCASTASRGKS